MHLHTVHQPGASMEGHIYNAHTLGMKYIRFTDHDTRLGQGKKAINTFDFSKGVLEYETDAGVTCGWEVIGSCEPTVSDSALRFSISDKGGVKLNASGKKQSRALLSDVTLKLAMKHELAPGARLIIDILLSQRPPDNKEAHLLYVIGESLDSDYKHYAALPLKESEDGCYTLEITRDAEGLPQVGGLDNVFGTVSFIIEGEGSLSLSALEISSIYEYNDLMLRQRKLADEIGARYGIKPFATTEISGAGQHKNCFSTSVPVLDYSKGKISAEMAVEHVLSHGGIFAYNHPFESSKYKRVPFTREELDGIVRYESETLAENRVWGASLMEVGFPLGRGLFTLGDYLKLWDNLALSGVFITGYGDSDSHKSNAAWFSGNNFASWIGVDDSLEYPIAEEVFNEAMVKGRVYMGDPVLFAGEVSLTCLGAEIGSVFEHNGGSFPVKLSIPKAEDTATVKLIRSGECILEEHPKDGRLEVTFEITPDADIEFIRAEMYNAEGRCIMLTNPIYFVKEGSGIEIPEGRRATVQI